MTQNELSYMLAIAEHGSLTAAADELFIAQPSLSECLARIETEFGRPLFTRSRNGMVSTEFGTLYLQTARDILNRYRQMLADLDEFKQIRRGSLSFGIPMNLGAYLLPAILPSFQKQYPEISVRFQENNSTELGKLMLSGKLEFAIMHYEKGQPALYHEPITDDPFYLVMPIQMASRYQIPDYRPLGIYDLRALSREPLLMIARHQKLRLVADSILAQCGIIPNIRYTTKSMETAKRLAAAGMGITFLPLSYLNLFSGTEKLACYPLDSELHAHWTLTVSYPERYPLSRCATLFIEHLKQALSQS